jgi:hypothetical protein
MFTRQATEAVADAATMLADGAEVRSTMESDQVQQEEQAAGGVQNGVGKCNGVVYEHQRWGMQEGGNGFGASEWTLRAKNSDEGDVKGDIKGENTRPVSSLEKLVSNHWEWQAKVEEGATDTRGWQYSTNSEVASGNSDLGWVVGKEEGTTARRRRWGESLSDVDF